MSKKLQTYQNKYTNLGYEDLRDYVFNSFIKKYFENTYNNFSPDLTEDNLAKLFLECSVALTDILNFYLNDQFKELNLDTVEDRTNLWNLAKANGYNPKIVAASKVNAYLYCQVRSSGALGSLVDLDYVPVFRAQETAAISTNGQVFELLYDVDMSESLNSSDVTVSSRDGSGNPTAYSIRKLGQWRAGKTVTSNFTISSYKPFRKITLSENNVIDVTDVKDAYGNTYSKTNFLAEDTVYERVTNTNSDSALVPYVINMKKVPYRFIVGTDPIELQTYIQFGAGDSRLLTSSTIIPDPSMYAITFPDDAVTLPISSFNPQLFTSSLSLGISPDVDVTVRYVVGGGISSNIGAGELRNPYTVGIDYKKSGLDATKMSEVKNSFAVLNIEMADGGKDLEDDDLVRELAKLAGGSQSRLVVPEDYITKLYSMPSSFGSVYRIAVEPMLSSNTLRLYVISKNANGNLALPSNTLLENIKNWLSLNRLIGSGIEIMPAEIINLKLQFKVMIDKIYNKQKVLWECINRLKEFYAVDKMQIGQALVLSNVDDILSDVEGVYSVEETKWVEDFSVNQPTLSRFSVKKYKKGRILYMPNYGVPEILNPNSNIQGVAI